DLSQVLTPLGEQLGAHFGGRALTQYGDQLKATRGHEALVQRVAELDLKNVPRIGEGAFASTSDLRLFAYTDAKGAVYLWRLPQALDRPDRRFVAVPLPAAARTAVGTIELP